MKYRTLCLIALAFALIGCEEEGPLVQYDRPLTSPGGQFSLLPPAVQNTVRAEAGAAEIDDISSERHGGSTVYKFHFKETLIYPPLYVASDGSVLTPDLQVAVGATAESIAVSTGAGSNGIKLDALPKNVVNTIRSQAPTAAVDFVQKTTSGSQVFYEVFFTDPEHHPRLLISEDGTLVR